MDRRENIETVGGRGCDEGVVGSIPPSNIFFLFLSLNPTKNCVLFFTYPTKIIPFKTLGRRKKMHF